MAIGSRGGRVLTAAFALLATPASTATITRAIVDGAPVITIRGEALAGDGARFAEIVAAVPPDPRTIVDLAGPGGLVGDGLRIGLVIHRLGWTTRVGDGMACYSTCAFTWIAGKRRLMSSDAHLAFHAPFNRQTYAVTEAGRKVMALYAAEIDLNPRVLAFMMAKAPGEGFGWLDAAKAKALGLEVEVVPAAKRQAGQFSTATVDAVEGLERDERKGGGNAMMRDLTACYATYRRLRTEDRGLQCFALETAAIALAQKRAKDRRARVDWRFTMPVAGRRVAAALMATGHNRRSAKMLIDRWMADLHATAAR